jgi:hypothetical protein
MISTRSFSDMFSVLDTTTYFVLSSYIKNHRHCDSVELLTVFKQWGLLSLFYLARVVGHFADRSAWRQAALACSFSLP